MKTTTWNIDPAHSSTTVVRPTKALNIALWIAQVLLAAMFTMAGLMKVSTPIDELVRQMPWAASVPSALVRFIGTAELAGAFGLLLPSLTRILPRLTALAGAGLTTIMLLAIPFHLSRGETPAIAINLVLGSVAAFIAWGRFKRAPIAPR